MAREKTFRFKRFAVVNDRTAMKVGTDGVLLGAWCPVGEARRVLDVGTGCGVIALMVAQRNGQALIEGIDIDPGAIEEATLNFAASPWGDRLTAQMLDFNKLEGTERYDLIVSNPPYFTDSLLPPDAARSQARHTHSLSYAQLIDGASQMLTEQGVLAFISPTDAETAIIEAVAFAAMSVQRMTRVIPVEGAPAKRTLWLLSQQNGPCQTDTLTIAHNDGTFTSEYRALVGDFYLKM